jgi:hypothetical protein
MEVDWPAAITSSVCGLTPLLHIGAVLNGERCHVVQRP